jgi:hypothetical protein
MKKRTIIVRAHERKKPGRSEAFVRMTKKLQREINRIRVPAITRNHAVEG